MGAAALCVLAALTACTTGRIGLGRPSEGGKTSRARSSRLGDPTPCESHQDLFIKDLWVPVLAKLCLDCHSPDGIAVERGAALELLPAEFPNFLETNLQNLKRVALQESDGQSVLLRKPLGEMDHGGRVQLDASSDEYAALAAFVSRLKAERLCDKQGASPRWTDVELLDAAATYRKATLQIAGRLPTPAERALLEEQGDEALASQLDSLLEEEAFIDRLKDIYNDQFHTDLYLRFVGAAIELLNWNDYPNRKPDKLFALDLDTRAKINRALAREPLELVAHVVRSNRPLSEILTADYTVVNPYSALIYGVDATFADPTDEREFVEARVTVYRAKEKFQIPHAGVLTTPVMLNRMPTSETNRNRHRARRVLELFLGTDVLRFEARPLDVRTASQIPNPTRDDPQCNGCHRQIDPIAGAFMKWDARDYDRYRPYQAWYPEMFAPGFGTEVMAPWEYDRAQRWLAERIVKDPRFVLSVVYTLYTGLTGHKPLPAPTDAAATDFDASWSAWSAQSSVFNAIGARFVENSMNVKTVVRDLVMSPYFRARNAKSRLYADRETELASMGTGRFSIPSVLANKIRAVTGRAWAPSTRAKDYLLAAYKVPYGGIDSDGIVDPLSTPNGIMVNVARRMANEMACALTAEDFQREPSERLLFPFVELTDLPTSLQTGEKAPAAVEHIKANIRYLHDRFLGEQLAPDDEEVTRTFRLFFETWNEGMKKRQSNEVQARLPRACQASGLRSDNNYVLRAWMAVLSYLLADYKFLYE